MDFAKRLKQISETLGNPCEFIPVPSQRYPDRWSKSVAVEEFGGRGECEELQAEADVQDHEGRHRVGQGGDRESACDDGRRQGPYDLNKGLSIFNFSIFLKNLLFFF